MYGQSRARQQADPLPDGRGSEQSSFHAPWVRRRRMNKCSENRGSLGARASSPAVVFKNRAIHNNTTEAANALLFREAVGIGQILRARRPRSQ
jgi:hypothetical protein